MLSFNNGKWTVHFAGDVALLMLHYNGRSWKYVKQRFLNVLVHMVFASKLPCRCKKNEDIRGGFTKDKYMVHFAHEFALLKKEFASDFYNAIISSTNAIGNITTFTKL